MPVMSKPGFLAKTDSGLRRLLSEEVWSWCKDKKAGEVAVNEPSVLHNFGIMQHAYSDTSSRCPGKQITTEEQLKHQGGTCKPPALKSYKVETELLTEGEAQKQSHVCPQEKHDSLEKCIDKMSSRDETSSSLSPPLSSSSSSSSGCPIRVRSLPNSPDRSWRSQKSVGSFTSLPEFQRASSVFVNISVSSSDIDDDLPFDPAESICKVPNTSSQNDYETNMGLDSELCIGFSKGKKNVTGNFIICSVQNKEKLETVPSINKNLGNNITEVAGYQCVAPLTSCEADIEKECKCIEQVFWPKEFSPVTASDFSSPLSQETCNRNTDICCDSSSGDDGPLEEKSEACSHSSEGLAYSEDEMIFSNELDNEDINITSDVTNQLSNTGKPHLSSRRQSNIICYKRKKLFLDIDPESSSSPVEYQVFGQKCKINKPTNIASWKSLITEEALSEILSPVDEILSYGSAELPPSITGVTGSEIENYISPLPVPSSEITTWTSEEDVPPPPPHLDEHEHDKSPTEDPSIVSEDLPSLSEDLLFSIIKEESDRQIDKSMDYMGLKSDILTKMSDSSTLYENIGDNNTKNYFQDKMSHSLLTMSMSNEIKDYSDPLSSFSIGDRVLVFHSKPGELKFKGTTSFASGHWAGVALDSPTGKHNGTFQGTEYFKCSKNCGVLVRPEDISHLTEEQESDLETRVDDDPFSDDESSDSDTPEQGKKEAKYSEDRLGEKNLEHKEVSGVEYSASRKTSKDGSPVEEMNNNSCPALSVCSDKAVIPVTDKLEKKKAMLGNNEPLGLNEILQPSHLHHSAIHCRKADLLFSKKVDLQGEHADLCVDRRQPNTVLSIDLLTDQALPREFSQGNIAQDVQHDDSLLHTAESKTAGFLTRCCDDLDSLVEKLMIELIKETLTDAQELRRRRKGRRTSLQDDSHCLDLNLRKREDNQNKANQLGFSDQWHCARSSSVRLKVQAHDPVIVCRLVDASVEKLCGRPASCIVDITDAPSYLINEESRKAYRQVIFDLTSEVFHETLKNYPKSCDLLWKTNHESSAAAIQRNKSSLINIKAIVQMEVQKVLNLERNDLQMKEILQVMCKYGKAQRDQVDYILIQELHKEELQWVDYRLDQLTVKVRMTEEIFSLLLQDTISVLNQIYTAPPNI